MFTHSGISPEAATGLPSSSLDRAVQACRPCSQLKRRCQRELPSCSLCVRLGKSCEYPTGRKPYGSSTSDDTESPSPSNSTTINATDKPLIMSSDYGVPPKFPDAFFIDIDFFQPVSHSALRTPHDVPSHVSQLLGSDAHAICGPYFSSVDTWFPFVSKKRLGQNLQALRPTDSSGLALLLLCMKLVTDHPQLHHSLPAESMLYRSAKSYLTVVEEIAPASLAVLQSLVLLSLYETGHGIFPAAYLTVGRAARIGLLRGVHNRKNCTQLFQTPQTYTIWEEERRSWWAVSILDRYLNINLKGIPLATPEPAKGDLLPTSDTEWHRGGIAPTQAVYATSFSPNIDIGPYARACQASQILGRVIAHRNSQKDASARAMVLDEAQQLISTLAALDTHLSGADGDGASMLDVALCTSARLALYHLYACNLPDVEAERFAEESAVQAASIEGTKQIVGVRGASLAMGVLHLGSIHPEMCSPLVIQALYDVATECIWFVREDVVEGAENVLELLVDALRMLGKKWELANKCLDLLKKAEEQ